MTNRWTSLIFVLLFFHASDATVTRLSITVVGNEKDTVTMFQLTEDGLHLKDTLLWFDTISASELSFLSSVPAPLKKISSKVIASEGIARILENIKMRPNILVCQYNRPFSVGRLRLELLPSGHGLGGASLYVENEKQSLLYAPNLLCTKSLVSREYQLKSASLLVLSATSPIKKYPTNHRKKEMDRFKKMLIAYVERGIRPTIFCDPYAQAQDILIQLKGVNFPIMVDTLIYRVCQAYSAFNIEIGSFRRYLAKKSKNFINLVPIAHARSKKWKINDADHHHYVVFGDQELYAMIAAEGCSVEYIDLLPVSHGHDYEAVIQSVDPQELYFLGPFAKEYAEFYKTRASKVRPLFEGGQPPLF